VPLDDHEREWLDAAAKAVPRSVLTPAFASDADHGDYVTNLLVTVLELRMRDVVVDRAIRYYQANRWDEIRTLDDLERVLTRFPDDPDGRRAAATYLWGYLYGERVGWLCGLVRWVRQEGITDQDELEAWAYGSDYDRDFAGKVKGLGIAAYCSLLMRLGVDTVKPDVWVHTFVRRVVGRDLNDADLIREITDSARRVGRSARELDGAIWESERRRPGPL
jgi:hypothetical protein